LTVVVDASVVVGACLRSDGFEVFSGEPLVAPALMWSEARSALHEARFRSELRGSGAEQAVERLERAPVKASNPRRLGPEARRIADRLGWAKTYDAEYLALASIMEVSVLTLDLRLRRGADRLGLVLTPDEWERTR
jgi:predicted nucleic acid-binding protein